MKITDIKPYPVWVGHRNQHIVKVETDEGIYGWGESGLSSRELAVVGAVKHYRGIPHRARSDARLVDYGRRCTGASILRAVGH